MRSLSGGRVLLPLRSSVMQLSLPLVHDGVTLKAAVAVALRVLARFGGALARGLPALLSGTGPLVACVHRPNLPPGDARFVVGRPAP